MLASLDLLLGTLVLRPYVFAFLLVYLLAATAHMGFRRTVIYIPLGYALAWLSEYSSIHWGFPYGDYYYIPATVGRELWVLGVPFMDSLSYVFLSYCSYSMAIFLLSPVTIMDGRFIVLETHELRRSWETWVLGAFLFVLLDIIIDPVALQGHRWFLGQIYGYRVDGFYFGIPMSNFGGWLLVGFILVGTLQLLDRTNRLEPQSVSFLKRMPAATFLGPVLYLSVIVFNLTVTFWIGEALMGLVGCLLILYPALLGLFFTLQKMKHVTTEAVDRHLRDFPARGTMPMDEE